MNVQLITKSDVKEAVLEVLSELNLTGHSATSTNKTIYGLQGLADFLGVGVTTAWNLKKSGKIPYYQAGKKVFFKENDVLEATLKSRRA